MPEPACRASPVGTACSSCGAVLSLRTSGSTSPRMGLAHELDWALHAAQGAGMGLWHAQIAWGQSRLALEPACMAGLVGYCARSRLFQSGSPCCMWLVIIWLHGLDLAHGPYVWHPWFTWSPWISLKIVSKCIADIRCQVVTSTTTLLQRGTRGHNKPLHSFE